MEIKQEFQKIFNISSSSEGASITNSNFHADRGERERERQGEMCRKMLAFYWEETTP